MIDFHNAFWKIFTDFLTVKAQNTLMKFISLLNPLKTKICGHLFKV